jgi:membrane protein YdbS with pleckstrin-like domain
MLAVWIKGIEKTLLKITILVVIFSVFLELNTKDILNYFIFLGVVYAISSLYILFKMSYRVEVYDDHVFIKNFFASHTIKYQNITDFFITEGYLQRKFGLHSIYIITKTKNYLLKDLPEAEKIHNNIEIELNNSNIKFK